VNLLRVNKLEYSFYFLRSKGEEEGASIGSTTADGCFFFLIGRSLERRKGRRRGESVGRHDFSCFL